MVDQKICKYGEMSPTAELHLSETIVSLHPHKKFIGKCGSTKYIIRPCWGLFVKRFKKED